MTLGDLALSLLMIALTCRTCQFPLYLQSSSATRRRDWRARSRSSRVAVTSLRVVVDAGTLRWSELRQQTGGDDVTSSSLYVDHCISVTMPRVAGLFSVSTEPS